MIPCKKATRLLSKKMDEPLTWIEHALLWSHLFMCWCCLRFEKQIKILRIFFKELAQESIAFEYFSEFGLPALSPEARERILIAIRRQ